MKSAWVIHITNCTLWTNPCAWPGAFHVSCRVGYHTRQIMDVLNKRSRRAQDISFHIGDEVNCENELHGLILPLTSHKFLPWKGRHDSWLNNVWKKRLILMLVHSSHPCQSCQTPPCFLTADLTTLTSWFSITNEQLWLGDSTCGGIPMFKKIGSVNPIIVINRSGGQLRSLIFILGTNE